MGLVGCAPHAGTPTGSPHAVAAPALPARLAQAPDQFFTAGGVRLRYRETGRGAPVVLLHGFTRRLEDWTGGVGDSLALDYRVIALDERGSGQSTTFADPARYGTAMADDVVRLLDHLHVRRAYLVGHSMGAAVAANVAARYPDRVVAATLVAPPAFADSIVWERETARWVADLERGDGLTNFLQWLFPGLPAAEAARGSAEALTTNAAGTMAALLHGMGPLMLSPAQTAGARVPVLIAVGGRDPLRPRGLELAARWPGARLLELPGADHGNAMSRPEVLAGMRALMPRSAAGRPASAGRE